MLLEKWQPRVQSLVRWDPFAGMTDLRREMDQIFGEFFGRTPSNMATTEAMWSPLVDIHETKDSFLLQVELPGVKQEDIQVSVEGDTLTLKGELKRETEVKEDQYHRIERSYGAFSRTLELPPGVNPDAIKASIAKGVLTVTVPKPAAAQTKKIEVKSAA